jgi:hypothetical protein
MLSVPIINFGIAEIEAHCWQKRRSAKRKHLKKLLIGRTTGSTLSPGTLRAVRRMG